MKARAESFGAWVALDDATLVALDRTGALRIGIDGGALWNDATAAPPPRPLEVHLAVTSRCPVTCSGCYQNASPDGQHVPAEALIATLDALAAAGVFTVAFGGGEPITRPDLPMLAREARARGLVPVVTTSGIGLCAAQARALRAFSQVNVSHDGVAGSYRTVRGFDGSAVADRAIITLVDAGVPVGVNFVLTRTSYPHVEATAEHVRKLGATEIQLLRYKPAGRAASVDYLSRRLTREQVHDLYPLLATLTTRYQGTLSVRIDCALVPFLSPHVTDASLLSRWGVFGCEAGRHLAAVDREGTVAPCSFSAGSEKTRVTGKQEFDTAWEHSAAIERFRAFVNEPPQPCGSCSIQTACRGGCKVVSQHLHRGEFVPDPECPRVIRYNAGEAI